MAERWEGFEVGLPLLTATRLQLHAARQ